MAAFCGEILFMGDCKCHCANARGWGVQGVQNAPGVTTDKCITRLITTLASYCIPAYLVWAKSVV